MWKKNLSAQMIQKNFGRHMTQLAGNLGKGKRVNKQLVRNVRDAQVSVISSMNEVL